MTINVSKAIVSINANNAEPKCSSKNCRKYETIRL